MLKVFHFYNRVSFKGFIEIWQQNDHFAWSVVIGMKPKDTLCSKKGPFSVLSHSSPNLNKFWRKCENVSAAVDNIQQKVSRVYTLVQCKMLPEWLIECYNDKQSWINFLSLYVHTKVYALSM
jgi:hypothetical protein